MAFDFPNAPGAGQTVTGPQGQTYQWDGTKWASYGAGTAYAPLASPVFTGDARAVTPAYGDNDTSIPTTAFVQSAVAPVANNTGRNLVMNGAFAVQQRGAGPWTTGATFMADRWQLQMLSDTNSVTVGALSDAQRAAIGDEAATYNLSNTFTGNAAATAVTYIEQRIEGLRRLAGKTVTVSFWAVASGTQKLGINMAQVFGTGGSPSANLWVLTTGIAVQLSTTWTRYSVTISLPSIAGKTLGTNGNDCTGIDFFYSSGANQNATSGNIGVQSGAVALYGCQLEIGSVATPFDAGGTPQQQLAACQRFYQAITASIRGNATAVQNWGCSLSWQPMRALPTITLQSGGTISNVQALSSGSAAPYNGSSGYFNVVAAAAGDFYALSVPFVLSADL